MFLGQPSQHAAVNARRDLRRRLDRIAEIGQQQQQLRDEGHRRRCRPSSDCAHGNLALTGASLIGLGLRDIEIIIEVVFIAVGAVPVQHILQAKPGITARIRLYADVDDIRVVDAVHAASQCTVLIAQALLQIRLHILPIKDIRKRADIRLCRIQLRIGVLFRTKRRAHARLIARMIHQGAHSVKAHGADERDEHDEFPALEHIGDHARQLHDQIAASSVLVHVLTPLLYHDDQLGDAILSAGALDAGK